MSDIAGFSSGIVIIGLIIALMIFCFRSLIFKLDSFETNAQIIMYLALAAVIVMGIFIYSVMLSEASKWQYLYLLFHFGLLISLLSVAIATFVQYSPLPLN
jgi:hypothetical protein